MDWLLTAWTGLMGLLILRREDSGTRNDFLGESSGPYIWGKEKRAPGISGSQGELLRLVKGWSLRGLNRICRFIGTAESRALPANLMWWVLLRGWKLCST